MAIGDRNARIRLISPNWFDHVFGTGVDAELQVGEGLWTKILQQLDRMPLTRGCGLEFGVVGRSGHNDAQLRGHQFIRGPDMQSNVSVLIYIGPELSKPPTPPAVSQTHKLVAELFSTGLSCSLAVMGWVGTIGSAAGTGASFGMSSVATIYFANAAALASAQCVGSGVHAGLVGWGQDAKADAMSDNSGFKTFDRVADFTNFLAILSVGRNLVTVSRALKEAGLGISDAALGQVAEKDLATMAKFLKLTEDAGNVEGVANFVKGRILDAVLYGMGLYSSSRDDSGGLIQARDFLVGKPAGTAPPWPGYPNAPAPAVANAAASSAMSVPGRTGAPAVAPRIVDDMLRYKADEVANISVLLLKKRG